MRIAVAGGTGTVGRHVVDVIIERGHVPVVLSRAAGVDLITGSGLGTALSGTAAVIDVLNVSTTATEVAVRFFSSTSERLLAAERDAGVGHHVTLSIVGIDGSVSGYYAGKLAQERTVSSSDVAWTVLRATQFHEFAGQLVPRLRRGPLTVVPMMRTQPIAAREVAERLVELAVGDAQGRAPDLGGPREERLVAMVRAWLQADGVRGPVVSFPLPGATGRAMRTGALLPGPDADRGRQTFAAWLAARA